jgi:hypothetical protein
MVCPTAHVAPQVLRCLSLNGNNLEIVVAFDAIDHEGGKSHDDKNADDDEAGIVEIVVRRSGRLDAADATAQGSLRGTGLQGGGHDRS